MAKAIPQSLVELNGQRSKIQGQLASTTMEAVARALQITSSRQEIFFSIGD